jgi:hypothetical protein
MVDVRKLLVFSRFAAVPGALSGLVSFGLEAKLKPALMALRRMMRRRYVPTSSEALSTLRA